jgi:hypothetical protein
MGRGNLGAASRNYKGEVERQGLRPLKTMLIPVNPYRLTEIGEEEDHGGPTDDNGGA